MSWAGEVQKRNDAAAERHRSAVSAALVAAERLGEFSSYSLRAETGISENRMKDILRDWKARGIAEFVRAGDKGRHYFRLTAKAGSTSPAAKALAGQAETPQGNMWRSMRGLPVFSARDIAVHSTTPTVSVDDKLAQGYCRMLERAGYLKIVQKEVPGRKPGLYKLVKDTGPRPPREKRVTTVYDENKAAFAYIPGMDL